MSIIFIGGIYDVINEQEVIDNTKIWVDFSGNNFQRKILAGFEKKDIDFKIISAPSIGSYPNNYKKAFFKKFAQETSKYKYVKFCNLWGYRNISRAKNLEKELIRTGIDSIESIIVYSVHTPFLEAAVYAKKKNPNIKICLIVPDIPEFMNLNKKKTLIYKVGKKYDIKKFYKLCDMVDSFVFLTEAMNISFNKNNKPYLIQEGVNEQEPKVFTPIKKDIKHIVYTGKLSMRFGIANLIDAFMKIDDPNLILDICGDGEYLEAIKQLSETDKRIIPHGPLSQTEIKKIKEEADVFVNPRLNDEEFTKYSFPSKNIEYLVTGKPVVAYYLDGMKENYRDYLFIPKDNSVDALAEAIKTALQSDNKEKNEKFIKYASSNLDSGILSDKILDLCKKEK